jgi:hypothetical protein
MIYMLADKAAFQRSHVPAVLQQADHCSTGELDSRDGRVFSFPADHLSHDLQSARSLDVKAQPALAQVDVASANITW